MKKTIIFSLSALLLFSVYSASQKDDCQESITNNQLYVLEEEYLDTIVSLIEKYHPNPYGSYSKAYIMNFADSLVSEHRNKIMPYFEVNLQVKKMLSLFSSNDPHILFNPNVQLSPKYKKKYKGKENKIKVLPFSVLQIGDTLLVAESGNELLQKGDRMISINGTGEKELLHYQSQNNWRSYQGFYLQLHYPPLFAPNYSIEIERQGEKKTLSVEGTPYRKVAYGQAYFEEKFFEPYDVAYFRIAEFSNNKFMAKKFQNFVAKAKQNGCSDVIIDLRNNPGGSGYMLEAFFSVISNKDSLLFSKSRHLKVSDVSKNDYDFLSQYKDGDLVRLPDSLIYKSFALEKSKFIPEVNYYLIIDKGTHSTAAAFANIFQYNELGILAGEALLHNALRFGDVCVKPVYAGDLVISTAAYNEHTKALKLFPG